jgi:hypothetical protein
MTMATQVKVKELRAPKFKYRFKIEFTNFGKTAEDDEILAEQVVSVKLPTLTFNGAALLNNRQIVVLLRDDKDNLVSDIVDNKTTIQATGGKSIFTILVTQLSDDGNTSIKTHTFSTCTLNSVDSGELDYTKNEPCEIKLVIDVR